MLKKTFAIAVLAAASAAALAPMAASAQTTYTIVRVAPPAPVLEAVPTPRHGWVWAPGYYDYRGGEYSWVQGRWVRERPGYAWREARWVEMRNGEWRRVGGSWERGRHGDRDHDGIVNSYDNDNNNAGLRPNGDRDGDAIRNKDDRHPYDPNRS